MKYWRFPSLPVEIETCYNLFTPRRLKKIDLRSLDWERLEDWTYCITAYVGGEDEFRELLPRFFELSWQDAKTTGGFDSEPLYSLGFIDWLPREREAIEASFALSWQLALDHRNGCAMGEILQALQWGKFSWLSFLNTWLGSSASTRQFAEAFNTPQWENLPVEVRQWLCQPAVAVKIQADFFAAQTDEEREVISEFEQHLAFYCGCHTT